MLILSAELASHKKVEIMLITSCFQPEMHQHQADSDRGAVLWSGREHSTRRRASHHPEPGAHLRQPLDLRHGHLHRGLHRRLPRDRRGQPQEGRGGVEQERTRVRGHPDSAGHVSTV